MSIARLILWFNFTLISGSYTAWKLKIKINGVKIIIWEASLDRFDWRALLLLSVCQSAHHNCIRDRLLFSCMACRYTRHQVTHWIESNRVMALTDGSPGIWPL